jgi:lipoprotein-releasing system ATP-binding protein
MSVLEVSGITKEYPTPAGSLRVVSDVNLSLENGESISIVGPSGSGKSTLLYMLGALEPPTSGTIRLDGTNPYELNEKHLAAFRNEKVGFVFQDHHLLPQCTVLENVLVPTLVAPKPDGEHRRRALELLEAVALDHRLHHRPEQLSGGEKQRVAVARALVRRPQLLLCDEPTGNLDHETANAVAALLARLHQLSQGVLIVVTHNLELAAAFGRAYRLSDARLQPL